MSDLDSDDDYEPHKSKSGKAAGPIERAAWTRVECFKVEKLLMIYGYTYFCSFRNFLFFVFLVVSHIDNEFDFQYSG